MADLLVEMFEEAAASGQLEQQDLNMDDSAFVQLLDSMAEGHPMVVRLQELARRARLDRLDPDRARLTAGLSRTMFRWPGSERACARTPGARPRQERHA